MSGAVHPHFWRRSESDVVRREYPAGGAKAVARHLPNRSMHAIYSQAAILGLSRPGGRGRPSHG